MHTIQIDLTNARQRKLFLDFSFRIYKGIPQWVPPMSADVCRMLDPQKHPFYKRGEAAFFLALNENDKPIGRLGVLDNHRYNEYNRERTAFFYLFECIDDQQVAQDLFRQVVLWVRKRDLGINFYKMHRMYEYHVDR